ncbi:hypothetical protein APR11_006384 [Nocardia amikacinitolerans]|nr:hypothetical protein [Nocardia amikacinitolerans]
MATELVVIAQPVFPVRSGNGSGDTRRRGLSPPTCHPGARCAAWDYGVGPVPGTKVNSCLGEVHGLYRAA